MADTNTSPTSLIVSCTWSNEYLRNKGSTETYYLRITKSGKVNTTDNAEKATRFETRDAAVAAMTSRQEYNAAMLRRSSNAETPQEVWTIA